jgi:hypothetical protein
VWPEHDDRPSARGPFRMQLDFHLRQQPSGSAISTPNNIAQSQITLQRVEQSTERLCNISSHGWLCLILC